MVGSVGKTVLPIASSSWVRSRFGPTCDGGGLVAKSCPILAVGWWLSHEVMSDSRDPVDCSLQGCSFFHLPRWLSGKVSACQCRRHKRCGFDPWVRRFPGEGNGHPLQHSCLERPWRGAWWATVHGIAKSWTQPSAHTYVQVIPEKSTTIHCAGGFTAVMGQPEMLGIQISRWSA